MRPLLLALAASTLVVGVWVSLTGWTGKTYHLALVLAALAPAATARLLALEPSPRWGAALIIIGLTAAALGWTAIALLDIGPHATIVDGQPGGALGEVVAGAVLGAIAGASLLRLVGPRATALTNAWNEDVAVRTRMRARARRLRPRARRRRSR